jgi:dTMP kinase
LDQEGLAPDLTLLFDAPVEVALGRAAKRGQSNRFEEEDRAFYERIRSAYLARAAVAPDRYRVIDASLPELTVQAEVRRQVAPYLRKWGERLAVCRLETPRT